MIAKLMQNEILFVDSIRQDKQSISLKVLYLSRITKNKEVDLMSRTTINRMIFNYLLITFDQEDQLEEEKKNKSKTIYYTFVNNSIEISSLAWYKRLMCIVLFAKSRVFTITIIFCLRLWNERCAHDKCEVTFYSTFLDFSWLINCFRN